MNNSHSPLPGTPRSSLSLNAHDGSPSLGNDGSGSGNFKPRRVTGESLQSLVGASLTVVDNSVYVFGGFDYYTDEVFNRLFRLDFGDVDDLKWKQVIYTKGRPPTKRNDHSATLWGKNQLVIFGGKAEDDKHCNDIVILNLDTLTWTHPDITGPVPEGRIRHSATIYNNILYVAGGNTANQQFSDTLLALDLLTFTWLPPTPFVRRSQHISFTYSGRLYVFGGLNEDMRRSNLVSFIDLNDLRSPATNLIVDSSSAPALLDQSFFQVCGDQLVVVVTQPLSETEAVSPGTNIWTLDLRSMQWRCRELHERLERYNWHAFAMAENATVFYLFGTMESEPEDYYARVLPFDLEELGIVAIPPPQLSSHLGVLLPSDKTTDQDQDMVSRADYAVCSSIDGGRIPVHRLILAARWPHFVHVLRSRMAEATSGELTLPEPTESLHAFVRYLYMDDLDNEVSAHLVCDLLVMSDLYQLPRLRALCVRRLYEQMDIETASKIYHCATRIHLSGLQHAALRFIFNHFGEVSHTEGFRNLPVDILWQIWDATPKNAAIVGFKNGNQVSLSTMLGEDQNNGEHEDRTMDGREEDEDDDDDDDDDDDERGQDPMDI